MEKKRILVVDDETQITRVLRRGLIGHDYEVRTAADGESGLDTFRDFHPDVVITDLQMPEMSGLDLCREIRKVSQVPIIVLSVKGEENTKVAALDAGADDYVTKPFGMDELLARVRAALRRAPTEKEETTRLEAGDFVIDLTTYTVSVRGKEIHLTPKELDLLIFLLNNHSRVLTHRTILNRIPPRVSRKHAKENRAESRQTAVYPHRAVGRIPVESLSLNLYELFTNHLPCFYLFLRNLFMENALGAE